MKIYVPKWDYTDSHITQQGKHQKREKNKNNSNAIIYIIHNQSSCNFPGENARCNLSLFLFEPLSTGEEVLLPVPSAKRFITEEKLPRKFS